MAEIRRTTMKDLAEVRTLVDGQLGVGYFSKDWMGGIAILVDGKIVSYGYARAQYKRDLGVHYFVQTVATYPEFQGMGFATRIVQELIDGCTNPIYATGWESKRGVQIEQALLRNGFKKIKCLPDYYKALTNCTDCGDGNTCHCNAWLYGKNV